MGRVAPAGAATEDNAPVGAPPPLGVVLNSKPRAQSRRGNALGYLTSEDVNAVLAGRMISLGLTLRSITA
jgi:hypothetical protein